MDSYDFESKHLYRQRRERAIDAALSAGRFRDRKVAYLDTKEALDTISYLNRGYRPQNLWAINRNPAEVAALSRKLDKLGFPRVNTVGLDFEEALERRVPEVDVVDFDGMSCLHEKLIDMLYCIVTSRPSAVYGVTILAGREMEEEFKPISKEDDPVFAAYFSGFTNTHYGEKVRRSHEARVDRLLANLGTRKPCKIHIPRATWDMYISTSNQPMVWCVFQVIPHRNVSLSEVDRYRDRGGATPGCRVEEWLPYTEQRVQKLAAKHGIKLPSRATTYLNYWDEREQERENKWGTVTEVGG